jgi:hypothetical protein
MIFSTLRLAYCIFAKQMSDATAFTGRQPLSGAATFIWRNSLFLAQKPL